MLKPDTILVQEIKVVPAKAKIMDMVAIRHPSSNADHRTTLILLCEDGSLRIYMAAMEQTGVFTLKRNVLVCVIRVLSDAFVIMNLCKRQQMEDLSYVSLFYMA
jgi:E3 ubiquitin-protein ligase UBR4